MLSNILIPAEITSERSPGDRDLTKRSGGLAGNEEFSSILARLSLVGERPVGVEAGVGAEQSQGLLEYRRSTGRVGIDPDRQGAYQPGMLDRADFRIESTLWDGGRRTEGMPVVRPTEGQNSLQGKSLQQQVDEAGVFDIYVLWASTNDYTNKREIGEYTDYTEFDGFNEQKLTTQAGGINYCNKKIYEKNPDAIIYFFTSSKAFINRASYDPFVENGMVQYVDMQKKICTLHGIPVLDQFEVAGFNTYNQSKFYRDPIHMNYLGYQKLGELQVSFLAFPK